MKNYPLIVIGAGAGGLVVAIGAAKAGKKVLLIEKGNYGGECTNFGCIPSKSLIASANAAHAQKEGAKLGIHSSSQVLKTSEALTRTRRIVEEVRAHEEPAALELLGVDTITGTASFKDPHVLQVGDEEFYGQKIVIKRKPIPSGTRLTGRLSSLTSPSVAASKPEMIRSIVLLPQPLGPIIPTLVGRNHVFGYGQPYRYAAINQNAGVSGDVNEEKRT